MASVGQCGIGEIRIVRFDDGSNPGFGRVIGLRVFLNGLLGFIPGERAYTYYGIDNSGFPAHAKGSVEGKTWTYDSESKMGDQTVKTRVTLTETSATSYSFKFEMASGDAPLTTFIEGKGTKSGT